MILVPAAAGAGDGVEGSSAARSEIVRLVVGSEVFTIATDEASTVMGQSPAAVASFVAARAGEKTVGARRRSASGVGDSDDASIDQADLSIGDLVSVGSTGAGVHASAGDPSTSSATAQLGGVSILRDLVQMAGAASTSYATTSSDGASAIRTVTIDEVRVLALGPLLEQLGATPYDLACESLAGAGAALGVEAGDACDLLTTATSAVTDALSALADVRAQVEDAEGDARASVSAAEAALAVAAGDVTDAAAVLAAAESALGAAESARDVLQEDVEEASAALGAAQVQRAEAASSRDAVAARTAGYDRDAVQADRFEVANTCAGLDATETTACEAEALLVSFPDLASQYGIALPAEFTAARGALLAAMDEILADFDQLATLQAAVEAADGAVGDAQAALAAAEAALAAAAAEVDAAASAVAVAAVALTELEAVRDAAAAALGVLQAQADAIGLLLASVDAGLVGDGGATCASVGEGIDAITAVAPSLAGAVGAVGAVVHDACAALTGTVEAVAAAPLLVLEDVEISITVTASGGDADVAIEASAAGVRVGGLEPIAFDLAEDGDTLHAAQAALSETMTGVTAATNLGLPAPDLTLMATQQATQVEEDGTHQAEGSVSVLRVAIPSAALELPAVRPLALVEATAGTAGAAGGRLRGARGALSTGEAVAAGAPATPALSLDVGVFEAEAAFTPADVAADGGEDVGGADGDAGESDGEDQESGGAKGGALRGKQHDGSRRLPRTGTPDLVTMGLAWIVAGVLVRRVRAAHLARLA